jgi:hypothetical protein
MLQNKGIKNKLKLYNYRKCCIKSSMFFVKKLQKYSDWAGFTNLSEIFLFYFFFTPFLHFCIINRKDEKD